LKSTGLLVGFCPMQTFRKKPDRPEQTQLIWLKTISESVKRNSASWKRGALDRSGRDHEEALVNSDYTEAPKNEMSSYARTRFGGLSNASCEVWAEKEYREFLP